MRAVEEEIVVHESIVNNMRFSIMNSSSDKHQVEHTSTPTWVLVLAV